MAKINKRSQIWNDDVTSDVKLDITRVKLASYITSTDWINKFWNRKF